MDNRLVKWWSSYVVEYHEVNREKEIDFYVLLWIYLYHA